MRCFLRAENEGLTIGSVLINVLEVRHDSVKLGITDPDASPSYREEVIYIHSDDGEQSDGDEADAAADRFEFEAVPFEEVSPFALLFR